MTATVLEPFDTQMFDYQNDLDFSMHVSSTDPWFQDEAVMEDDDLSLHTHNVEVDMEPYDDHHNEYEMEDGPAFHEFDASHPVDVDISGGHTSVVVQTTDTHPSKPLGPVHTSLDLPKSSVSDLDSLFLHEEISDSPQSPHTPLVSDVVASSDIPLLSPKEETYSSTPSIRRADIVVVGENLIQLASDAEKDPIEVAAESDSEVVGPAQQYLADHTADDGQNSGVHKNDEIIPAAGGTEESHSDGSAVSSENIPQSVAGEGENAVEYEGSADDPHEISEGVYIDPPPAVLLSFPIPNHPEICLFNRADHAPSADLDSVVLLSHLPTLYYEPISSVFEALRQEEHLVAILESMDGELVFDAYDLQLTIHEVTHLSFAS